MKKILKCPKCSEYTMQETCSKCNKKTINPKPAKYSPEDKYGKYRRIAKTQFLF
tara:strand:- start:202 stop:363 length:162 start_codon:yes stop_codon:yes gene_type:complete